jgi:hypothetical protein
MAGDGLASQKVGLSGWTEDKQDNEEEGRNRRKDMRRAQARNDSCLLLSDAPWGSFIAVQAMAMDTLDEHVVKALQVVPVLVDQLVKPCIVNVFGCSSLDEQNTIHLAPLDDMDHQVDPLVKGLADVALPNIAGEVVSQHL